MSKDLTSEFTKTMGEQTGSAKTHLDSAIVPSFLWQTLYGETSKLHELFSKDLSNLIA